MISAIRRCQIYIERMVLMMAMFFAQRVILGKQTFASVPKALQRGCAQELIDSGLPELVPDDFRATMEG